MNIGILGSGDVAKTLASGFLAQGHAVKLGSRDPQKLAAWQQATAPKATLGSFAEAAKFGEVLVLAVKGLGASQALSSTGADNLKNKVIVDTTNPIAEAPPKNGALSYFTSGNESLMGRLQREFSEARFVKAFNSVGAALMVNPKLPSRPSMYICGNDAAAKKTVTAMLDAFGWDTEDVGGVETAMAVEALCILWCAPGFLRNDWTHAFKSLR